METQTYEIEAWLGDDHGLTDDQVEELRQISEEIYAHYCTPDPDVDDPEMVEADLAQATEDEREAALTTAYRILAEGDKVVDELAADLSRARLEQVRTTAGLRQAALMLVPDSETEAGYARRAGVTRKTLRAWTGK